MLNQVIFVGRTTSKIEVVKDENGAKYAVITLAIPRSFKNSEGEYDTDQDVASEYGVSAVTVKKATLKVLNMYKEKIYKSNETTLENGFQKVKKTNE